MGKYDLNDDGDVNVLDLGFWMGHMIWLDLDKDGKVDVKDAMELVGVINGPYDIKYDFDRDGKLDNNDIVVFRDWFKKLDFNGDGVVNIYDFWELFDYIYGTKETVGQGVGQLDKRQSGLGVNK
jgi:hypothetical protein